MMSESQYKMPKVDIVLISYNTQNLLLKCLHSLFLTPQGIELGNVIIVDNASSDKTIENIKAYYPGCIIIGLPTNIGYAGAVNEGMKKAKSSWVFIGNADMEFRNFSLSNFNLPSHKSQLFAAVQVSLLLLSCCWQSAFYCYPVVGSKLIIAILLLAVSLLLLSCCWL